MNSDYTVIVAGAGPAGCILARDLARRAIRVRIYERGARTDLGHNWSDAVERSALAEVGIAVPPEGPVNTGPLVKKPGGPGLFEEHAYPDMEVWAPDYSCRKMIKFRYITTDRRALADYVLKQALEAGAEVLFRHEITGLTYEGSTLADLRVGGVKIRNLETGESLTASADVVVDASGLKADLRTALPGTSGIAQAFGGSDLAEVFRTVRLRREDVADAVSDHYRYGYHTGYQWFQRLNEREIDTGAGVRLGYQAATPRAIVQEFISRHPSILETEVRGGGGICLVGRSPFTLVCGGFAAIGDSAGQTIPMTGCGAGGAMVGAKLAAEAISTAAHQGRSDIAALWPYNHAWASGRGAHYAALTAMKNILQGLDEEETSFLFRRDIISAAMLTDSINGCFTPADPLTGVKTFIRCLSRPPLLLKLAKASSVGTAIYRHYQAYPRTWDAACFEDWRHKAEQLFARAR